MLITFHQPVLLSVQLNNVSRQLVTNQHLNETQKTNVKRVAKNWSENCKIGDFMQLKQCVSLKELSIAKLSDNSQTKKTVRKKKQNIRNRQKNFAIRTVKCKYPVLINFLLRKQLGKQDGYRKSLESISNPQPCFPMLFACCGGTLNQVH